MRSGKNNGATARKSRHRLLVVDDEDNVRVTTAAILEQEGYEVETASDGQEALKKVRESKFDLVLTDLRMEGMDGNALLNVLCANHPNIVTVVLTGYASIESSIDALRCGVYDYLIKPCVIDDLKMTVRRALEHKPRQRHHECRPMVEIWTASAAARVGALDERVPLDGRRELERLAPGPKWSSDTRAHGDGYARRRASHHAFIRRALGSRHRTGVNGAWPNRHARQELSITTRRRLATCSHSFETLTSR